jgi:hypothetical protein
MTRTIYRAELETRNFHFEAFDDSESSALGALISGLEAHAIAYGLPSSFITENAADARVLPFTLGACYRDREEIK